MKPKFIKQGQAIGHDPQILENMGVRFLGRSLYMPSTSLHALFVVASSDCLPEGTLSSRIHGSVNDASIQPDHGDNR